MYDSDSNSDSQLPNVLDVDSDLSTVSDSDS